VTLSERREWTDHTEERSERIGKKGELKEEEREERMREEEVSIQFDSYLISQH
jgi:hypothetical protein